MSKKLYFVLLIDSNETKLRFVKDKTSKISELQIFSGVMLSKLKIFYNELSVIVSFHMRV